MNRRSVSNVQADQKGKGILLLHVSPHCYYFKEEALTTSYSCLRNTLGSRALLLDLNLKYCASLILSLLILPFVTAVLKTFLFLLEYSLSINLKT